MEPRIETCGKCEGKGSVPAATGPELAAARQAAGLSMRAMGALMGFGKSYVNELEKGHRDPYPELIEKWFSITGRIIHER